MRGKASTCVNLKRYNIVKNTGAGLDQPLLIAPEGIEIDFQRPRLARSRLLIAPEGIEMILCTLTK